jgi:hypothetical protein
MFRFTVAVLATWRVAHLLAREDGPGDLFVSLRRRASAGFGRMLDCIYCLSLWISAPAALWLTRDPVDWVVTTLAISGAACLLERFGEAPVVIHPIGQVQVHEEEGHGLLRTAAHVDA